MHPAGNQWRLSSSLPLAALVLSLAVGSWGVFAGLLKLVHSSFELLPMDVALVLATPAATGLILYWPLHLWAVTSTHPGGVLMLLFLALTPTLAGLTLASNLTHLLLVGVGMSLVPGCFAAGVIYLHRLTGIPGALLTGSLLVLCLLGAVFAYASTPVISEAFGWRLTPLMSIVLIAIAAGLFAALSEPAEPPE